MEAVVVKFGEGGSGFGVSDLVLLVTQNEEAAIGRGGGFMMKGDSDQTRTM